MRPIHKRIGVPSDKRLDVKSLVHDARVARRVRNCVVDGAGAEATMALLIRIVKDTVTQAAPLRRNSAFVQCFRFTDKVVNQ